MAKFWQRLGVLPAFILGITLFAFGLITLSYILNNWWPNDVSRLDLIRDTALGQAEATALLEAANTEILLAFLAAVLVTGTGIMLPLAHFLNKRFGRETIYPPLLVTLRQAMWFGLWAAFCIWLQMNRMLGSAIAGLVAVVFLLMEMLIQIRTQTQQVSPP